MKCISSTLLLSTILAFVIASPAVAAPKHSLALGGKVKPLTAPFGGANGTNSIGLIDSIPIVGKAGTLQFKNANGKVNNATYTQSVTTTSNGGKDDAITVNFKSEKIQENVVSSYSNNTYTQTETISVTKNGVTSTENVVLSEHYNGNNTDSVSESITVGKNTQVFAGTAATTGNGNGEDVALTLYNSKGLKENLNLAESQSGNINGQPTSLSLDTTGTNFAGKSINTQVTEAVTSY